MCGEGKLHQELLEVVRQDGWSAGVFAEDPPRPREVLVQGGQDVAGLSADEGAR